MVMNALGDSCPSFVWNNNPPIRIIPGTVQLKKHLDLGGFTMDADLVFQVNVVDLPLNGQPTLKQTITYLNGQYRIVSIGTMAGGLTLEYRLVDVNAEA